jgi:hypothetical protein
MGFASFPLLMDAEGHLLRWQGCYLVTVMTHVTLPGMGINLQSAGVPAINYLSMQQNSY